MFRKHANFWKSAVKLNTPLSSVWGFIFPAWWITFTLVCLHWAEAVGLINMNQPSAQTRLSEGKTAALKWRKLHFIVFTVHTTAKHTCHRCCCLLLRCWSCGISLMNEAWARDAELTVSAVQINLHFYLNVKNMKWGSNKSHVCDADKISTTVSLCLSSAWMAVAALRRLAEGLLPVGMRLSL